MKENLKDLRIADLDLFITAAHLKNLGKAAALHHLSQSAASAAIMRVESALGKSLCVHERRQFRLTEEGRDLLPKAEEWLKNLKETVASVGPLPIRLATTHAIARVSIPAIWPKDIVELKLMRPDMAYASVLNDESDIALVLDNSPWDGVISTEIGKGSFQLYSKNPKALLGPILLPEDQIEVITFQQRWKEAYDEPLLIKARLPSWSLIADLCANSKEVGFLPDFLGREAGLHPVSWQPSPSRFRVLALYKRSSVSFQKRLDSLIQICRSVFF